MVRVTSVTGFRRDSLTTAAARASSSGGKEAPLRIQVEALKT